jgi:hypothetical protein
VTDFSALLLADREPEPPRRRSRRTDLELAAKHGYIVEPGSRERCPGITHLAGMTERGESLLRGLGRQTAEIAVFEPRPDGMDDRSYARWLSREVASRWKGKAARGTRVHEHHEAWSRGEDSPVRADDEGLVDALAAFWSAHRPQFLHCEVNLGNARHRFGCRADAVGHLRGYDGVSIWDIKTGSNRRYSVLTDAVQVVGQSMCDVLVYEDGMVAGWDPLPQVTHLLDVYLSVEGTFRIYETAKTVELVRLVEQLAATYWAQKAVTQPRKGRQ